MDNLVKRLKDDIAFKLNCGFLVLTQLIKKILRTSTFLTNKKKEILT